MPIRDDFRCDVCDESARYVKPPVEISVAAFVCEGRGKTPVETFDVLPEWIRLVMRGLAVPVPPGNPPEFVNVLRLCGVCTALLASTEGLATIVAAIAPRVRPMPPTLVRDDILPVHLGGLPPVPPVPPVKDGPARGEPRNLLGFSRVEEPQGEHDRVPRDDIGAYTPAAELARPDDG